MATAAVTVKPISVFADYLSLAKLKSIIPHLVTAAAAMFLAAKGLPVVSTLVLTLTGGGLVAAASNTLNNYLDRDLDKNMLRTDSRPLPSGRLHPSYALLFSCLSAVAGLIILGVLVNITTAFLALGALIYYVIVYTLFLKRRTYWSAIIGSGVGALTPLIGWAAVTNRWSITPFILSAVIILWTLPHFWSLAIYRRKDYNHAGIQTLPPKGPVFWINVCSILLVSVSIVLVPAAGLNRIYLVTAGVLGGPFIFLSFLMYNQKSQSSRILHLYSIVYISLLFTAMIIDRLLI